MLSANVLTTEVCSIEEQQVESAILSGCELALFGTVLQM